MFSFFFSVVFFLFAIGAVLQLFIVKKQPKGIRDKAWVKFAVYFLVVVCTAVVFLMVPDSMDYANILSVFFGFVPLCFIAVRAIYELAAACRLATSPLKWLWCGIAIAVVIIATREMIVVLPTDTLLYLYTLVVVYDGFCQLGGQLLKGPKLWPAVSPAKTWYGLLTGSLVTIAVAILSWEYMQDTHISATRFYVLVLLVIASSTAGDLAASAYKRMAGIKDFDTILPEHGGVLDRYDSWYGCMLCMQALSFLGLRIL